MPDTTLRSATISVLVENEPGILARVVGLFSGRGYNIDSLTVAPVESERGRSRVNIVTSGTEMVIEQIKAQLDRLVPVHRVADLSREGPHIARAAHRRRLPRPRDRRHARELRIRTHRRHRQARRVHRSDETSRPGGSVAHRHRCDSARRQNDLGSRHHRFRRN
jgi:acetolactate synthase regulatory subunit